MISYSLVMLQNFMTAITLTFDQILKIHEFL